MPARIFLNYRREDTLSDAEHLYASLALQFGSENVFRDVAAIKPGEDFPAAIERAISSSQVVLSLIGKKWLTLRGKSGRRRLFQSKDYVRMEIEFALSHGVDVIPVLADGARMPVARALPKSIAKLAQLNAYSLGWHNDMGKLGNRITEISRGRAEREAGERARNARVDLVRSARFSKSGRPGNVIIKIMELSLDTKGFKVALDPRDLDEQVLRSVGRRLDQGIVFRDMLYVIDHIGVRALGRKASRYCARSEALASTREIADQLKRGHPVLAGASVRKSWFSRSVSGKGIINTFDETDPILGGVFVAIVGHDPLASIFRFLSPWPTWGEGGFGWMTEPVAEACLQDLHSVDATRMGEPPEHLRQAQQASGAPGRRP